MEWLSAKVKLVAMRYCPLQSVVTVAVIIVIRGIIAAHGRSHITTHIGENVVVEVIEPIEGEPKLAVPQRSVEADIGRACLGPTQIGIGNTGGVERADCVSADHAVGTKGIGAQERICRHIVITQEPDRSTNLQVVKPEMRALHELLVGYTPAGRERREEAPTLARYVAAELIGTIVTATELREVSVGIIVFHTEHIAGRACMTAVTADRTVFDCRT